MDRKLLVATGNLGKVREFKALFDRYPVVPGYQIVTLNDLNIRADVDETGATYYENAALKAHTYAKLSGLPTISDDSGLEVAALDGAPGLRSARFSPKPGATDADRRAYLLEKLSGKPGPWRAKFCCVVVFALPNGEECYGEGTCPGFIIPTERGEHGFGYDPVFELPMGLTMAELDPDTKNRLSHRALAVEDIHPRLIERLGD